MFSQDDYTSNICMCEDTFRNKNMQLVDLNGQVSFPCDCVLLATYLA